ncbi:MAG TPA: D-tyrosyl-tRNA(Tyr) deacylase [Trueperaceae bacterium]|nr:D-tyrosyl-tRNA(Tyr) deacylase [Trueperaceae bacterium]
MRALIQRVSKAKVEVDNKIVGEINNGLLILLGISPNDSEEIAQKLALKISKLRIFNDEQGKMNLSVKDIGGSALVISQFTLYANAKKGNRPSYTNAAPPKIADELYQKFSKLLAKEEILVENGIFAADMKVELLNDGPVTIFLDSEEMGF